MFEFEKLAPELQKKILLAIDDTHTICQARLVCHQWYQVWEKIPNIEDSITLGFFILEPNIFKLVDLEGKIIRELKFKSYGRWYYTEFSSSGSIQRKIENKTLFMTECQDNTNPHERIIRKVDARAGTINELKLPILPMGAMCCIS